MRISDWSSDVCSSDLLLLASWLKGFVEFVRLRFLVELRCHELAQAGRIGVSRLSGRVGRLGCGGHGHDAEERQKHCELLSTRLLNILFLAKGECSMSAEKGSAFLLKVGDGGSPVAYATVAGLRTTQLTVNGDGVNVTTKDRGGWR